VKRLVLLRHGLTPWNAERRFQGHADIELTETGHTQAAAAAQVLASYAPVQLWCSDLSRAVQTAEYVAEATQLVPVLDERLREIHVGDFEGKTHPEILEEYGPEPWDYAAYGGESDAALAARVAGTLLEIAAGLGPQETAVVVSHGHAIRSGAAAYLGIDRTTTFGNLENCGWVDLVQSGADGAWRLTAYNRVAPIS
jgi:glucosyl-3-phosphoglycerate phosphatase